MLEIMGEKFTPETRRAVLEIAVATKANVPQAWRQAASQ
jgi:hypothetical protein